MLVINKNYTEMHGQRNIKFLVTYPWRERRNSMDSLTEKKVKQYSLSLASHYTY
jgi:hypothetical protein